MTMRARLSAAFRPIAVTIAALIAYRFAHTIPLPGIDVLHLADIGAAGAWDRISIMALGVIPWLSALMLAELAVLFLPVRYVAWLARGGLHADPFAWPILTVALAFALLQGYGVGEALTQFPKFTVASDIPFSVVASISLVGGTALAMLIALLIQRHGIGMGFWVLVGMQGLRDLSQNSVTLFYVTEQGAISFPSALMIVAATGAAIAAVVFLMQARHTLGFDAVEPVIWPIQLGSLMLPWVGMLIGEIETIVFDRYGGYERFVMLMREPAGAIMLAVLIAGIAVLYARQERSLSLVPLACGVLCALAVGMMFVVETGRNALLSSTQIIIVTVVFYAVLADWRRSGVIDRSSLNFT